MAKKSLKNNIIIFTVILFFLSISYLYWYLSHFSSSDNFYSKEITFKGRIHDFQTIVETYGFNYKTYPKNVKELRNDAVKNKYWKELRDTFKKINYDVIDLKALPSNEYKYFSEKIQTDSIGYYIRKDKKTVSYAIYGIENNGKFLTSEGNIFYLTGEMSLTNE